MPDFDNSDLIVTLVALLMYPPLAVLLHTGLLPEFALNIVLTMVFYLPGVAHAIWVITRHTKTFHFRGES